MGNIVKQDSQAERVPHAGEVQLPPEVAAYVNAAREKSAELHGDFQEGETPSQMMARMNSKLDQGAALAPKPPRRKRPMVRQVPVEEAVPAEEPPKEIVPPAFEAVQQQPQLPPEYVPAGRVERSAPRKFPKIPAEAMQLPEAPAPEPHVPDPILTGIPAYAQEPAPAPAPTPEPSPQPAPIVHQVDNSVPHNMGAERRNYDAYSLITALPSKGLFYKNAVYGQCLSLEDILLLSGATPYDTVDIFDEILRRRVKGVLPGEIMWCDEAYIFQWLRISSFPTIGIPYPDGFKCHECGYAETSPDYQISFKNMDFRTNIDPKELVASMPEGYFAFHFSDGRECNVYPRKRRHDRPMQEWLKDYVAANGATPKTAHMQLSATAAVIEIEGIDDQDEKARHLAKFNYLRNLRNIDDYHILFDSVNSHSLIAENHVIHVCPVCGAKVDIVYPFRTDQYVSGI